MPTPRRPPMETTLQRRRRAGKILAELHRLYPGATCALHHESPFQLLIATILSAQSTDVGVNKVTPVLFRKYPTPLQLSEAPPSEVEDIIHATGFFRQKTKSIQAAAGSIVERFGGKVPEKMDDLLTLRGVARKTANVVLGTAFGKNEGVVVDTHVGRLAIRLELVSTATDAKDAIKIEADLMDLIPRDEWTFTSHALIQHGRQVCVARNPRCVECTLNKLCPSALLPAARSASTRLGGRNPAPKRKSKASQSDR